MPEGNILTRSSVVHPGRMVEIGFVPNYEPQRFALLAEGLPAWLFALERSFCSDLVILGFDSASSYRAHLESSLTNPGLVYRAISHLGLGRVSYALDTHPPSDAILLASGPVPFLLEVSERLFLVILRCCYFLITGGVVVYRQAQQLGCGCATVPLAARLTSWRWSVFVAWDVHQLKRNSGVHLVISLSMACAPRSAPVLRWVKALRFYLWRIIFIQTI
jgi:hypothetical protein